MASEDAPTNVDPVARHLLTPRDVKRIHDAEKAGEPFLAYRDGGEQLALHVLGSTDRVVTVGRRAENNLALVWDAEVSGLHAELRRLGGEWTIADDGFSTNGTFVGERRTNGRHRLKHGDRVRVGRTVLMYNGAQVIDAGRTLTASPIRALPVPTQAQRRVLVALCRPHLTGSPHPGPASNQQIAAEAFLSVDAVKSHLRTLFASFGVSELPQARKRARLAEIALELGIVTTRDL
jgi:FHA domain